MPYQLIRPVYGKNTAMIRPIYGIYHSYPYIVREWSKNKGKMVEILMKISSFVHVAYLGKFDGWIQISGQELIDF